MTIICVTVCKASKSTKLGITLRRHSCPGGPDGPVDAVVVKELRADSLFQSTSLQPGMQFLKINGRSIDGLGMAERLLKEATGTVAITVASTTTRAGYRSYRKSRIRPLIIVAPAIELSSVAKKCSVDEFLEMTLQHRKGRYVVDSILPDSSFASTLFQVDMEVVSINGISVHGKRKSKRFVNQAISDTPSGWWILAVESSSRNGDVCYQTQRISAKIQKERPTSKLGIGLLKVPISSSTTKSVIVISKMMSYSPFQSTDLKVGMTLIKVNGVDVSQPSDRENHPIHEAKRLLQQSSGTTIELVATRNIIVPAPSSTSVPSVPSAIPSFQNVTKVAALQNSNMSTYSPTSVHDPTLQTFVVLKETEEQDLGATLEQRHEEDGTNTTIWVQALDPSSPWIDVGLSTNSQVVSLNGVQLANRSVDFCLMLLQSVLGPVTLQVLNPSAIGVSSFGNTPTNGHDNDGVEWC